MKKFLLTILLLITIVSVTSCGSKKDVAIRPTYENAIIENPDKHSDSDKEKAIEKEAKKWLGTKYKYGGTSRKGVDCSGFVMEVYRITFGIKLPRSSSAQSRFCKEIKKKNLKKGDLVFFSINGSAINHVGIYLEKNRFIHASRNGVMISELDDKYYKKHYQTSGRVEQIFGRD